jgi:Protein of unknown function (DUF3419)
MNASWKTAGLRFSGGGPLFGTMHEDAAVERKLLQPGGRVLCVLSAGDVAFEMLRAGASDVVAADPNPNQQELVKMKVNIARQGRSVAHVAGRRICDVVCDLPKSEPWHLRPVLAGGSVDMRLRSIARWVTPWVMGPYESRDFRIVFGRLRWRFAWWLLTWAVRLVFPPWYRRHLPADFIQRLRRRFETCCLRNDAKSNPLLRRLLAVCEKEAAWAWEPTWPPQDDTVLNRLHLREGLLSDLVDQQKFSLVSASNILDTQPRESLNQLLDALRDSVKPGGWLVLRSLFWQTSEWPVPSTGWILHSQAIIEAQMVDRAPLCQVSAVFQRVEDHD